MIPGTLVAALIVFRFVWGFLGSTYAQFESFVVSPSMALRHGLDLLHGRAHHHVGHNPIGTLMIMALIAALSACRQRRGGAWRLAKEGPFAPFRALPSAVAPRRSTLPRLRARV